MAHACSRYLIDQKQNAEVPPPTISTGTFLQGMRLEYPETSLWHLLKENLDSCNKRVAARCERAK